MTLCAEFAVLLGIVVRCCMARAGPAHCGATYMGENTPWQGAANQVSLVVPEHFQDLNLFNR